MSKWYEEEVGSEVVKKKYLHEGETCMDDLVNRVSGCFSQGLQGFVQESLKYASFFPAGRSIYALGCKGKFKATTSNCYIMPMPEDDTHSINTCIDEMESIFKRGGGCGVNLSNLRPRGAKVQNSARTSTGAVSFMEKFDVSARTIGANNRRAALLIGLNCDHPDIEEFLQVKQNDTAIQAANISILFTDEFMTSVVHNLPFDLEFEVEATGEKICKTIDATDFFRRFCAANKEYAEPGAIFIDKVRLWNLLSADKAYVINIPNPCAEYYGSAYNACNLGSTNLYSMVENKFTKKACIPLEALRYQVDKAVRVLDEILDYGFDLQPLDANRKNIEAYRAIGLGVFGLGDALIALGIRFGSKESIAWCEETFKQIFLQALWTSNSLARDKGMFEKCDPEVLLQAPILQFVKEEDPDLWTSISLYGLRNASLMSIAPTGTIATMCGMSGGAEPLFKINYRRTTHSLVKEGVFFDVFAKSVKDLIDTDKNLEGLSVKELQKKFPYIVASHDIAPIDRIKMQSVIQKYVDNAISVTVNMQAGSTDEEIARVYQEAWKQGCKGVTVFVDGCKRTAIMSEASPVGDVHNTVFDHIVPIHYSDIIGEGNEDEEGLDGKRYRGKTACVPKLYSHVYQNDGDIYEIFTSAESGGCQSNISTITKLASLCLRSGVKVSEVVRAMKSTNCPACLDRKKAGVNVSNSCGSAIGEALEKYYNKIKGVAPVKAAAAKKVPVARAITVKLADDMFTACPECGEHTLRPEGRCNTCHNCGYSRCD